MIERSKSSSEGDREDDENYNNNNSTHPDNLPAKLKSSVIISYCNDANGLKPHADCANDVISKEMWKIMVMIMAML